MHLTGSNGCLVSLVLPPKTFVCVCFRASWTRYKGLDTLSAMQRYVEVAREVCPPPVSQARSRTFGASAMPPVHNRSQPVTYGVSSNTRPRQQQRRNSEGGASRGPAGTVAVGGNASVTTSVGMNTQHSGRSDQGLPSIGATRDSTTAEFSTPGEGCPKRSTEGYPEPAHGEVHHLHPRENRSEGHPVKAQEQGTGLPEAEGETSEGFGRTGQWWKSEERTGKGYMPGVRGREGDVAALAAMAFGVIVVAGVGIAILFRVSRREERDDGESGGYVGVGMLLLRWWAVSMLSTLLLGLGCGAIWVPVRVARAREEIMAFSPVVPELMARAAGLNGECDAEVRGSSRPGSGNQNTRVIHRDLQVNNYDAGVMFDDPVGSIFGPGTQASRDFAPTAVEHCTERGSGGDCGAKPTPSAAAAIDGETPTEEVVFLTGATGLVGQMVLYDLLRLGAPLTSAPPVAEAEEGVVKTRREELGADQEGGSVTAGGRVGDRARCRSVVEEEGGADEGRRLKRVFVLVRPGKKGVSAGERLDSIKTSPMFRVLRETGAWVDDHDDDDQGHDDQNTAAVGAGMIRVLRKAEIDGDGDGDDSTQMATARAVTGAGGGAVVSVIEGDLAQEGLGLTAKSRSVLARAGVTRALHCAASVRFSDPLAEATATNITGALRVAALVASWPTCRWDEVFLFKCFVCWGDCEVICSVMSRGVRSSDARIT